MANDNDTEILKLRGHHLCCSPILTIDLSDRGEGFMKVIMKIKDTLNNKLDATLMVIEGIDELCRECPLCDGERCTSPNGDEDKVRRWDNILLKELGLSFGDTIKVGELQALKDAKTPFRLCYRCRWNKSCQVGSQVV